MKTITDLEEILIEIKLTIECQVRFGKSFFFRSEQQASMRRKREQDFEERYNDYMFIYDFVTFEIKYRYEQSCKHVYFALRIFKNGNKTNITALKNIGQRIAKELADIELSAKQEVGMMHNINIF